MSKPKSYTVVFFILLIANIFNQSCAKEEKDYQKNLEKYSSLLKNDPNNCNYLGQVARSYQALNKFRVAIQFYERTLKQCPDDPLNWFQLGVCHYLLLERDDALNYMDSAIKMSEKMNDKVLKEMLIKEKAAWLEKWESVKQMDWNKKVSN